MMKLGIEIGLPEPSLDIQVSSIDTPAVKLIRKTPKIEVFFMPSTNTNSKISQILAIKVDGLLGCLQD